jgi:hypothetical protein
MLRKGYDLIVPRRVKRSGARFHWRTASRAYDKPAPQMRMAGTDCRFKRRLSSKRDGGMENFLLFILSSSVCALVASVTLLLRPLVGLP